MWRRGWFLSDLFGGFVNGLPCHVTEQASFFDKEGIIPMPINWAQYMTPVLDMRGFSHEYTHTMIESLTGKDSRFAFKWLDEGLAEYEGNACRARLYPDAAAAYWYARRGAVLDAYRSGQLFKLRDISTEPEWSNRIQKSDFEFDLEYAEALVAVTKLMEMRGFSSFLKFLREWHTTKHFARQFENAFGLSLDEFESEFMTYVDEQSQLPPPEFSVIVRLANTGIRYSTYLGFHPWFVNPNVYYTTSAGLISGSFAFDVHPNGTVWSLDTRLPLWQHQSNGENYPYLYVLVYSSPGNPNGAEALAVYARYGVAIAAYRYYWYSTTSTVTYLRDFPLQPFPDGNGIIVVPKQSEVPSTTAVFTSTLGEFGAHESSPVLVMAKTDTATLQIVWAIKDAMRRGWGLNPLSPSGHLVWVVLGPKRDKDGDRIADLFNCDCFQAIFPALTPCSVGWIVRTVQ
jgi:hypothetical protein